MKKRHFFHLVNWSPWPIIVSLSLLEILFLVVILLIVQKNNFFWGWGIIILVVSIFCWFRDVMRESAYEGEHSIEVQRGLKIGMILFIISEIMFFVSFFWGYFHFSFSPSIEIGGIWPPYGIQVFNPREVPLYNTLLLLLSGVSITWVHHKIVEKKKITKKNINVIKQKVVNMTYENISVIPLGYIITLILAYLFTDTQIKEYTFSNFSINDGNYSTIFFLLTGFHGFHVLLGTCFLFVMFIYLCGYNIARDQHVGVECAIWYWHFVDIVWILLFILVYWNSYESII